MKMKKKPIELTESEAIELHKESGPKMRAILESNFGKKVFYGDIQERINDYQDCLKETGLPDSKTVSEIPERFHPFILALYKNIVIIEAYNEGTKFDIFNESVRRHYPYFVTNGSPSRFAFFNSYCDNSYANAGSGSRLVLKSEELSNDYGTKFKNEIIEMLTK